MRKLSTFRGYTIDLRLEQFRKIKMGEKPEFIPFQTPEGQKLFLDYQAYCRKKLLPKALLKRLPPLYSQEKEKDPMVWCKFFYPDFAWAWWGIEFDEIDTFFGLVKGDCVELGYFNLVELCSTRGAMGLPIERDRFFTPCRLSKLKASLNER